MYDQELAELIRQENQHYLHVIDLIASTNAPSRFLRVNEDWGMAQFRNAEGLIGRKPYAGMHNCDAIEALAVSDAILAPDWSRGLELGLRSRIAGLVAKHRDSDTLNDLVL